MLIRIRMDLAFDLKKKAQAEALRDALMPFLSHAKIVNKGKPNEEIGFIDVENCGHEEGKPCEKIARWEVGRA